MKRIKFVKWLVLSVSLFLFLPSANSAVEYKAENLSAGTGPAANENDELIIRYDLWLYEGKTADGKGKLVDSSKSLGKKIPLDEKKILAGLYRGLSSARVGDKWRFTLPANLAFGKKGDGAIPPNSDLIFEVEVLALSSTDPKTDH